MLRAIHLFPQFENVRRVHELRERFDPLHKLIAPHITLVFPFESEMQTSVVEEHVTRSVSGHAPFEVLLQGITGSGGEYLFLNVKRGNDEIIALHDAFYRGVLRPFLRRDLTFIPHLTVGRVEHPMTFQSALMETSAFDEPFQTVVREVTVESITANGESVIESIIPLDAQPHE